MIVGLNDLRERLAQSDWIVCAEVVRYLNEAAALASCGVISMSGPNGEPLACGYYRGHDGPHAWSTLPTYLSRDHVSRAAGPTATQPVGPDSRGDAERP